jgi:hypothetical protein
LTSTNKVAPAQRELPGAWLTSQGDDNMTDDTHAPPPGPGSPTRIAAEFQDLVGALVPEEMRVELGRLAVQGDRILCEAGPWSRSCREVFEQFEAILKPHRLSDERHWVVGAAVGIDRLYGQMNKLSRYSEPDASDAGPSAETDSDGQTTE